MGPESKAPETLKHQNNQSQMNGGGASENRRQGLMPKRCGPHLTTRTALVRLIPEKGKGSSREREK